MVVEKPDSGSAAIKPDYGSSMAWDFAGSGVRRAGCMALAHSETRWHSNHRIFGMHQHCCSRADLPGESGWDDGVWTVNAINLADRGSSVATINLPNDCVAPNGALVFKPTVSHVFRRGLNNYAPLALGLL